MLPTPILQDIVTHFNDKGTLLFEGSRNVIKIFDYEGQKINVKAFQKPSFFKKIVYRFLRESKAKRSYLNAELLLHKGISTPKPLGYIEKFSWLGLADSYYFCQHLENCFSLGEVVNTIDFPDREEIIRGYTRYFFSLHENQIEFIDNSLGNTLIVKENGTYSFYLVDLNRLKIHEKMDIETRMNNFSRLTLDWGVREIIAEEYAKLYPKKTAAELFYMIQESALEFHKKMIRKRNFKKGNFFDLDNPNVLHE